MLIAEELFLLLRRDDGSPEDSFAYNAYGLAAAVLADLILAERITVSDAQEPRLVVVSAEPTAQPVLDKALDALRTKENRPLSGLVSDSALALEKEIARGLADEGFIEVTEKRFLGLVPEKYPLLDAAPEEAVRRRLREVLAGGAPGPEDAVLLSILQGLGVAAKVLKDERGGLSADELKQRITDVSQDARIGDGVTEAVAQAVCAMNAALFVAVFIPVMVGGVLNG